MHSILAPLELKLAADGATGEFEGYGAVFGNVDSHGDMIMPGAFADSLAERKALNRATPMHLMHRVMGGDGLPVGVWKSVEEDSKGLRVQGKISGMNTDGGRLLFERIKDGALGGLSIGYKVKPNGASYAKAAGEPRRTLTKLHLAEISLVDDPSNPLTRVDGIKAAGDATAAAASVASAMRMHDKTMRASYSEATPKDKAILMNHLRDAHMALTGSAAPLDLEGWTKAAPFSLDEFRDGMKGAFALDDAQVLDLWSRLTASYSAPAGDVPTDLKSAAAELGSLFRGFSLTSAA